MVAAATKGRLPGIQKPPSSQCSTSAVAAAGSTAPAMPVHRLLLLSTYVCALCCRAGDGGSCQDLCEKGYKPCGEYCIYEQTCCPSNKDDCPDPFYVSMAGTVINSCVGNA
jgi:hypothetical protein